MPLEPPTSPHQHHQHSSTSISSGTPRPKSGILSPKARGYPEQAEAQAAPPNPRHRRRLRGPSESRAEPFQAFFSGCFPSPTRDLQRSARSRTSPSAPIHPNRVLGDVTPSPTGWKVLEVERESLEGPSCPNSGSGGCNSTVSSSPWSVWLEPPQQSRVQRCVLQPFGVFPQPWLCRVPAGLCFAPQPLLEAAASPRAESSWQCHLGTSPWSVPLALSPLALSPRLHPPPGSPWLS